MSKKPILFYHAGCPDGFGSAFSFYLKYGDDIDYYPLAHSKDKLMGIDKALIKNRVVYMADISLKKDDSIYVNKHAKEYIVLDHHLSAEKELKDLDFCHFDMNHSGAVLSWNYCFPETTPLKILQYIEDRDLWRWLLPYGNEILAAVDSYERSFDVWMDLNKRMEDPNGFSDLIKEGVAILRYNKTLIEIVKRNNYLGKVRGFEVPMINLSFFKSEILNELCQGNLFSAGYHFNGEEYVFSLRSTDEGMDVSTIASSFPGGGGHRNASGFSIKKLEDLN